MINKIVMPKTGQTMETGTIVAWRVKTGDTVKKGDIILDIETDKATLEIESFYSGQIKAIIADVGQEVPIEQTIALIGDESDTVDNAYITSLTKSAAPVGQSQQNSPSAQTQHKEVSLDANVADIKISPRAQKLAEKLGIDYTKLAKARSGQRIVEKDIQEAAASQPAASPSCEDNGKFIPANRLRKIIAEKMTKSKREIPCFYLNVKADVTSMVERRRVMNITAKNKVSFNDFIIQAVGKALVKYRNMTGQWTGDGIQLAESINIGLAISTNDGLVAAVVHDVDRKTIEQVNADAAELINKARANALLPTDLEGASITLSNLGMLGIDEFIPIVIPGQASILGVGKITDKIVTENGGTSAHKIMSMTLAVDHRVVDGAYAAEFLNCIAETLR